MIDNTSHYHQVSPVLIPTRSIVIRSIATPPIRLLTVNFTGNIHNEQSRRESIMERQNELTSIVVWQQSFSSLSRRDVQVFVQVYFQWQSPPVSCLYTLLWTSQWEKHNTNWEISDIRWHVTERPGCKQRIKLSPHCLKPQGSCFATAGSVEKGTE